MNAEVAQLVDFMITKNEGSRPIPSLADATLALGHGLSVANRAAVVVARGLGGPLHAVHKAVHDNVLCFTVVVSELVRESSLAGPRAAVDAGEYEFGQCAQEPFPAALRYPGADPQRGVAGGVHWDNGIVSYYTINWDSQRGGETI